MDFKRDKDIRDDELEMTETDSTTQDDTELEDEEAFAKHKLKQLRDRLRQCETEKRAHHEDLQRARAEFLNGRKRLEEQLAKDKVRIVEEVMYELLPLADSFELAMRSPNWEQCDETWRKGVAGIYGQLTSVLKKYDVTPINETGIPFDPMKHEAVSNITVQKQAEKDTVIEVLQTGYVMNDAVIRHAKVTVGTME